MLAASPYPRGVRGTARVLAALALVVPGWAACAAVVEVRAPGVPVPGVPVLGLGVEAVAVGSAAFAIGSGLRAWRAQHAPSFLTALGLVGLTFATAAAPRCYALQQAQTGGPPWEASQLRWSGLALVTLGVALLALHDPFSRRPPRRADPGGRCVTAAPTSPGR